MPECLNHSGEVFDPVRRKWVAQTPEEEVRQAVIKYLHDKKEYPLELMQVERYNTVLQVPWLLLTNGKQSLVLKVTEESTLQQVAEVPKWGEL